MVHCAATLHTVSVDINTLFENKALLLLQTSSPGVLYCGGIKVDITSIVLLRADDGRSERKKV